MVLEQLYPLELIERSPLYAFILGIGYSIIGIGIAVLLFPEDPAIVAVALIALMILPTLNNLLKQEEEVERKQDTFNPFRFYITHKNVFKVYILLFLGILLSFSFFSLFLPSLATNFIFENQINVLYGKAAGGAAFNAGLYKSLLINNVSVLILCFIAAFVIGDGAIFLITWNASVWGTIFGNLAKTAALSTDKSPIIYFFIVLVIVFPHMILEAFSYITSASAGGVISKGLLKEKFFSKNFRDIMKNATILFIFSIIILLIAVFVETWVLNNATTYQTIIQQSSLVR